MKKMSEVLIESQKTRKQITGTLVRNYDKDGKPEDYCALGALGCEAGLIINEEQLEKSTSSARDFYNTIVEAYGADPTTIMECPNHGYNYSISLSGVIFHLNDQHSWTFEQIGNWLKEKGY